MAGTGKRRKKPARTRRDGRVSRERSAVRAPAAGGRLREPPEPWPARLREAAAALLHPRASDEPVWRHFWLVLALAFAARAAVALYGDSRLHFDEYMQYLEAGHRLAFGNGVMYWEQVYGARSLLLPALIAGILELFDALGLGRPAWYAAGVKLAFCAVSLAIPAGMYFFARRHFGEAAARAALLAGAFWYELVGYAHKPLTALVAAALLAGLLALCVRPVRDRLWPAAWLAAFLAVSAAAVRIQYAPFALALLGIFILRVGRKEKIHAAAAAAALFLAVGVFDAVTWDAGLFQSYVNNLRFNLGLERTAYETKPAYQYLVWLFYTGGGLGALCAGAALFAPRRYGFLLVSIALVLLLHSTQTHKEYRFVFAVVPLWLLIGADLAARFAARAGGPARVYGLAGGLFAAVSAAGIWNALPNQDEACCAGNPFPVRFLRGQDPAFAAYRYLAAAPGVKGVWQIDRAYLVTPGYYLLHRKIPFYDLQTGYGNGLHKDLATLRASVSHIVTGNPKLAVPGYAVEKAFGDLRILRREENAGPVRNWREFAPLIMSTYDREFLRRTFPEAPPPPPDFNIRFVESE